MSLIAEDVVAEPSPGNWEVVPLPQQGKQLKVAIVHYWLLGMRGGEKVVETLCGLFPQADIFTHVFRPKNISDAIKSHRIQTSFIDRLPMAGTRYRTYLPLMPMALEQLDLSSYDLVISSESGPAKGVITRPDALHVCYCHSPMRYIWSGYHEYSQDAGKMTRLAMPWLTHRLRQWDVTTAHRVDHFVANSNAVADRIMKYYRRPSTVIYPPVQLSPFPQTGWTGMRNRSFYLFASQLVRYKRADIVVEACNRLGRELVVIGEGDEFARLRRIAGPTVRFLGRTDDATLRDHYARCRALVFAADEDFGMVPIEAMSAGAPVIAFGRGGALETVVAGKTGLFFDRQAPDSVAAAIEEFEQLEGRLDPAEIARHAQGFSPTIFRTQFSAAVDGWLGEHAVRRHGRVPAAGRP